MAEMFNLLIVFYLTFFFSFVLNKRVKQKFRSSDSNVLLKVGVPRKNKKVRKIFEKKL